MNQYEKLLDKIGMKINQKGYCYWIEALKIAENSKEKTYSYDMGRIYQEIAKKYKTSIVAVERNLRHSWQTTNNINEKIEVNYKINNSVFLAVLVRRLKNGNKRSIRKARSKLDKD